jgi:hypothetical protein
LLDLYALLILDDGLDLLGVEHEDEQLALTEQRVAALKQLGPPRAHACRLLTWMRRPTSVFGGKADTALTCQYVG